MQKIVSFPHCRKAFSTYSNPTPTVDMVMNDPSRGVLRIARRNQPEGFAVSSGFIDENEQAVVAPLVAAIADTIACAAFCTPAFVPAFAQKELS